jgi:hypothetical protein
MSFLHVCPHGRNSTTVLDVRMYVLKRIPDRPLELVPNGTKADVPPVTECAFGDANHVGNLL